MLALGQHRTPLSAATKVYEGAQQDVSVSAYAYLDRGQQYQFRARSLTFYTSLHEAKLADGSIVDIMLDEYQYEYSI